MNTEEKELIISFLVRNGHKEEDLRNNFSDEALEQLHNLVMDLFY